MSDVKCACYLKTYCIRFSRQNCTTKPLKQWHNWLVIIACKCSSNQFGIPSLRSMQSSNYSFIFSPDFSYHRNIMCYYLFWLKYHKFSHTGAKKRLNLNIVTLLYVSYNALTKTMSRFFPPPTKFSVVYVCMTITHDVLDLTIQDFPPRPGLRDMFKLFHYEPHGVVDIFLPVDFKYFVGERMFCSKIKIKHWGWRQCKILLTSTRLPSHYFFSK